MGSFDLGATSKNTTETTKCFYLQTVAVLESVHNKKLEKVLLKHSRYYFSFHCCNGDVTVGLFYSMRYRAQGKLLSKHFSLGRRYSITTASLLCYHSEVCGRYIFLMLNKTACI